MNSKTKLRKVRAKPVKERIVKPKGKKSKKKKVEVKPIKSTGRTKGIGLREGEGYGDRRVLERLYIRKSNEAHSVNNAQHKCSNLPDEDPGGTAYKGDCS